MKKLFFGMAACAILITSCSKDATQDQLDEQNFDEISSMKIAPEQCGTLSAKEFNIAKNPNLQADYDAIEVFTKKAIKNKSFSRLAADGSIEIPVVFHVIYRTASENLPTTQLQGQLDAMNEDFNLDNPGRLSIPSEFQPVETNVGISFVLEDVIRVHNSKKRRWRPNDSMKHSSSGGSDVINPEEFLNIWIVNYMPYQGGQILGYAQFPGGSLSTDGVVLAANFVGSDDRTATHEVGHYLNLRHIWGDGGCSVDDFVADTPISSAYNTGCPVYPDVSCNTADMTMNFMDYTADSCMNMFTEGQKNRMMSVFVPGGFRASMAD